MGITGLIQFIDAAMEKSTVHKLQGRTVALDGFWLLHKGSYCCSDKLVRGIKTTAMIDYALKYVRLLQGYCANIIMVFDGKSLPAKAGTEAKRRESREKAKIKAHEYAKNGQHDLAKKEFDKAVVITHDHALELMEQCRRVNVDCIVAMYEADSQLAYLNKLGLAEYIISEDSDLVLFGCKKIVYKLTLDGKCTIFDSDKLPQVLPKYTFEKFLRMCILSGCDYLNNLQGIGLSKAKKFIMMTAETDMKKAIPKIPSYVNVKTPIPDDYIENFLRAEATFKYMYVYDPLKKSMVRLNELENSEDEKYCVNAGELLKPDIAYQIAIGNINPKTMQKVSDFNPSEAVRKPPVQSLKFKQLFSIWNYNSQHETVSKVKQQSKLTFVPMKFNKKSEIISKIAEEENRVEDAIDMDNLINSYCGETSGTKRPSSVLDDNISASQVSSTKNPFAKRQLLDGASEKADNCSLIKALSTKETRVCFSECRVVSRFFKPAIDKNIEENPLEIIERIEAAKIEREMLVEERLEENKQFYNHCADDDENQDDISNKLNVIKEKYSNKTESDEKLCSQRVENFIEQSIDEESTTKDVYEHDKGMIIASQNSKSKVEIRTRKNAFSRKLKAKTTSLSLASQHKLSTFGFTKSSNIL